MIFPQREKPAETSKRINKDKRRGIKLGIKQISKRNVSLPDQ
ncbi:hypothetical protein P678_3867 [Acinetobacter baumannii UH7807]|uniref:Uncharacterized protein n=4 Tax=Acinetobacter baumannii TaxID=470 RepID=A0A009IKX0_ACIB9|nr:hypothetical protein BJAB0715_02938 [Acinetobacter baumannii BJAB0715]AGQ11327.1 hypothetical protein BJAB0868_02778 [Acinetobacter baumannii BJAB0868]AGQ15266.1 hypothetical protein BJAB07104_02898 [Acinetobacter baumannii BJAB07104]AIY36293.1 hypothetical protein ABLAC_09380 [Acinetobacter baumannii LAC-4]ATU24143.1 hypothetical protein AYP_002878 [Acinetobacter baumannii]EJG19661.1 hypothetical protein ACIN5189_A1745 [Acinetobacter baumannii OIFC189]EJG31880.1 hypothetical protein ACINN